MIVTLQFQVQPNRWVILPHPLWSLLVQINSLLQTLSTMFNNINHNLQKKKESNCLQFSFSDCCLLFHSTQTKPLIFLTRLYAKAMHSFQAQINSDSSRYLSQHVTQQECDAYQSLIINSKSFSFRASPKTLPNEVLHHIMVLL